jgi:hypothetical protein
VIIKTLSDLVRLKYQTSRIFETLAQTQKEQADRIMKRDELVGIFALGLLAIVVATRNDLDGYAVNVFGLLVPVQGFANIIILTWSAYAGLMILAYSQEGGEHSQSRTIAYMLLFGPFSFLAIASIVNVILMALGASIVSWYVIPVLGVVYLIYLFRRSAVSHSSGSGSV